MIVRPASAVSLVVQFFEPEIKPQKFGHRWGKINDYDGPEKLFSAARRETYLKPSFSIGGWLVGCGLPIGREKISLALCLIP